MSDLISRKKAIKQIKKLAEKYADKQTTDSSQFYVGEEDGCYSAIYILEEMESVEPKTGRWIERDDGWGNVFYECSECGEAFTLIDGTPTDNLYYYCPNCGAKMERRADEHTDKRD